MDWNGSFDFGSAKVLLREVFSIFQLEWNDDCYKFCYEVRFSVRGCLESVGEVMDSVREVKGFLLLELVKTVKGFYRSLLEEFTYSVMIAKVKN